MPAWLGIDFSGNDKMWSQGCRSSNVWIARVEGTAGAYLLRDLRTVQDLPGADAPFDRLVALLQAGAYEAAGIDAPFSVPAAYVRGTHAALLSAIGCCALRNRPFPCAADFMATVAPSLQPRGAKIYRETERVWLGQGVNTRSTVWAGPRGGAAMTAACLYLLHRAQRPLWPWTADRRGCLVEAFPAAQLKTWGLAHQQYNGGDHQQQANREIIVEAIEQRITLGQFRAAISRSADALDAVVAAFAGMAVTEGRLYDQPGAESLREGWIAVHRQ